MAKRKKQPEPEARAVQVVPDDDDYVLEARQVARAAYALSVMEKRLLWLFIAQVQIRDNGLELLEVSVGDIVRALHLNDSALRYEEVRAAVDLLMGRVIHIEEPTGWVKYHWVETARYTRETDTIQVRLSDELTPYVLDLKGSFAIIQVSDLARLQGKHSTRLFELVMQGRGFAGQEGNRAGEWFVDLDFAMVRKMFMIDPKEYKNTWSLRNRVIDDPIREINEAGLGLRITADYDHFRRGRTLSGVRLLVKLTRPGEPRDVSPATPTEKAAASLIDQYPEEYAKHLAAVRASPPLDPVFALEPETEALRRLEAEIEARKAPARKRGRPRKNPG